MENEQPVGLNTMKKETLKECRQTLEKQLKNQKKMIEGGTPSISLTPALGHTEQL